MNMTSRPWYKIDNESEIASPALLLDVDRVRQNLQTMCKWVRDPTLLRPHVKTHKLPQIVQLKLEAGITKFKCSTIAEAEMTAQAGGEDILLAYQPVGPQAARLVQLIEHYPQAAFSTIIDNADTANQLSRLATDANVTIPAYIDLNVGMDRTGIAPGEQAADLYKLLASLPAVQPAGLHAYDGHLHVPDETELAALANAAFEPVWALKTQLEADGYAVPRIVGCGTPTSKLMAQRHDVEVEVSAGTSVLWDAGQPGLGPDVGIVNAAVLLARVVSKPTSTRLCIDLGHKAVASEMPAPRVRLFGLEDAEQVVHSEEHLVLETDRADDFPIGTVVYGLPTHICPTVALYSELWCVREGRAVETWPVVARARRLTI